VILLRKWLNSKKYYCRLQSKNYPFRRWLISYPARAQNRWITSATSWGKNTAIVLKLKSKIITRFRQALHAVSTIRQRQSFQKSFLCLDEHFNRLPLPLSGFRSLFYLSPSKHCNMKFTWQSCENFTSFSW